MYPARHSVTGGSGELDFPDALSSLFVDSEQFWLTVCIQARVTIGDATRRVDLNQSERLILRLQARCIGYNVDNILNCEIGHSTIHQVGPGAVTIPTL